MDYADDNPFLKLLPLEENAKEMFFHSLEPLQGYFDDSSVAEILVNSFNNIWVEQRGVMTRVDVELNQAKLNGAILSLAASVDKSARAGTEQGIINAGHKGLRIAAVMRPTALDGHALAIRKHRETILSLDDYVRMGALSIVNARPTTVAAPIFLPGIENDALADALRQLVLQRKNILVAGGTSTGKTTFLNSLIAEIPPDQRVITIEDTVELKVQVPNRIRLLYNEEKKVTARTLLALCLRLRPDRIIVGEVRRGEAFDLLQALNTGHDGGMASVHGNDAKQALSRLESLAMLGIPSGARWDLQDIRKNIADCFHYVVHLKRTDELRHVSEIVEIRGFSHGDYDLNRVF